MMEPDPQSEWFTDQFPIAIFTKSVTMTAYNRPADLPDFERPPLNELVLSVQFGETSFRNVHAGLLWQKVRDIYPIVEEQNPIDPVFETFGPMQAREQDALKFLKLERPEAVRYWFVTQDGNELLQIQRDRIIHNWREQQAGDCYPRYEILRERFAKEVAVVSEFYRSNGIGDLLYNQCEVSYINIISSGPLGGDPNGQLEEIFTVFSGSIGYLGRIERGQFNFSFVLPGEEGAEPFGRLHVSIQPAMLRATGAPVVRMVVTARGKPFDEGADSAFVWLDRGREAAVRGFAALTTEKMHALWGRQDR